MHKVYLPFTEKQLSSHFADVKRNSKCVDNKKHLKYYQESIARYTRYLANNRNRLGKPLKEMKKPCQIEKDERFWIASSMMTIFHSQNRVRDFIHLFKIAYNDRPPIRGINSWKECLDGKLHLFFEANLPSPKPYRKWLSRNLDNRQFIPYVLDSANGKKRASARLEGATDVDAVLLNSENGFAVIIEAKVLSDISIDITYDVMRNQIARNIDVMLEKNHSLCDPLNKREPERTLFLLITPRLFKDNSTSRLYGYKFNEYKNNPDSLAKDLPHRKDRNLKRIPKRLGWLTWEDFKNENGDCCQWLERVR